MSSLISGVTKIRTRSRNIYEDEPELYDSETVPLQLSTEMEKRELIFDFEHENEYNAYIKLLELADKYHDPESYWEGLQPGHLYVEAFLQQNERRPEWVYLHIPGPPESDIVLINEVISFLTTHRPQKHIPNRELPKYVAPEEMYLPIKKFPKQYTCTGFPKTHLTIYDQEMQFVNNIVPGFSKPIPNANVTRARIKELLKILGKQYVIDMLHIFEMESILDIGEDTIMLYHLDAAIDEEVLRLKTGAPPCLKTHINTPV